MKILVPFIAAISCATVSVFAQSPAPATSGSNSAAPSAAPSQQHMPLLTPEENQTLRDAMQKARQDPTVQAANLKKQEAMKAARDAIVAKDKSFGPLFEKVMPTSAPSPGAARPVLSGDERVQLQAAEESLKGTPEGAALQKAGADYVQALHAAMIAADPAVDAIFAKLPQNPMFAHHPAAASPSPAPGASSGK